MIRGGILNSRARRTRRTAPSAARVVVAALAALGVTMAAAAAPALAVQRPGTPAASHTRPATRPHPAVGRMSPSAPWARIAAGEYYICGIRTGGTLWCWGYGYYGQLGIGNHKGQCHPQQVTTPAADGWASVTAGLYFNCATRTGGTLWCWGWDNYGQLGIGSNTDQELPQPVTTPATAGWGSIAAGFQSTCAIRTGGTLWCWGDNSYGQLGLGNHTGHDRPQQVTG